jgi:hypothetical protein
VVPGGCLGYYWAKGEGLQGNQHGWCHQWWSCATPVFPHADASASVKFRTATLGGALLVCGRVCAHAHIELFNMFLFTSAAQLVRMREEGEDLLYGRPWCWEWLPGVVHSHSQLAASKGACQPRNPGNQKTPSEC